MQRIQLYIVHFNNLGLHDCGRTNFVTSVMTALELKRLGPLACNESVFIPPGMYED